VEINMKNWKSTLMGFIKVAFLLVGPHLIDEKKPWVSWEHFLPALGVMGLGASAKDANVHSTVQQVEDASIIKNIKDNS
jgi:hypothetical protein